MTPTEKFKRAEALFNDRTKRELADMVVHREADLEDARAENEELWALNEHMGLKYMAAMGELGEENDQLKADNAKLRELLSVMAYCNQFKRDCDGCSMNGAAGIITERAGCDELLDRLRELGVEV